MSPDVQGFLDTATNTVSYVVWDATSRVCAIVDPVLDFDPVTGRTGHCNADRLAAFIEAEALKLAWLLETHVHADHLSAAPYLKRRLGGKLAIGASISAVQNAFGRVFDFDPENADAARCFDHLFADDETFTVGGIPARAMATPGHTPACMTFVIGDAAFVGDTMFMPDSGTARCDFPGGDARQLYRSIRDILSMPPETRLFMCHDYKAEGRNTFCWETTVAAQRAGNIHVRDGISEDEFVAMRTARDKTLDMPRLMLPSVQTNLRAGHLPPPEPNGIRYLRIPLDTF